MVGRHEHLDAAWHAGLPADETSTLDSENHLVDRRRRDAEAALDVGVGGRPQVDARVGVASSLRDRQSMY